jgi:multiple sugar transport system ATP-binding protein
LAPHTGKPATLGIRPENLRMATSADSTDAVLAATVEVSEQLGSEVILDVKCDGAGMVASVEPTVRVKAGETIKLALDPGGLRFFDAKTELSI